MARPARPALPTAPTATAPARRRPRLTGRAAILVLVLAVLTVSYASSLRAYLQQRDQIGDLKSQIALRQASIEDLEREKGRWEDPAYVRQQARELNFVMPGETSYVVLDENGDPLESDTSLTDPATVAPKPPRAWWSTAWESVEAAGDPPAAEPEPSTRINGTD
ncbi:septum formation initiator family protein [Nocardioides sp.]|uniref:FtsB family cell division protein n=1 Tax=Nocardioides sp. TaxID=35761 RepID=UPI00261F00ED|nr:septum formation initiator family protein [Nocardioides sp.]MDI6909148.1 septum formation initiator family protein [Nocardioides sp.]